MTDPLRDYVTPFDVIRRGSRKSRERRERRESSERRNRKNINSLNFSEIKKYCAARYGLHREVWVVIAFYLFN